MVSQQTWCLVVLVSFFSGVRLPPPGLPLYLSPLALQKDAAAVPDAGGLPEGRAAQKQKSPSAMLRLPL